MSIYTISTISGSAGKTTTASTLAIKLAQKGFKVLLIDLDSQANASTYLGYPNHQGPSIADVLSRQLPLDEVMVPARQVLEWDEQDLPVYDVSAEGGAIDNLWVVPAQRFGLDRLMIQLGFEVDGIHRLRYAIEESKNEADVIIIDTPGSLNPLVHVSMVATTAAVDDHGCGPSGLITCTKPAGKENEGIPHLIREVNALNRMNGSSIDILAIVPCSVPSRGKVYVDQRASLNDAFGELVSPPVRQSSIVDEAYTNYTPLPLYGPRAKNVNEDYDAVLEHLQKKLGLMTRRGKPVGGLLARNSVAVAQ